MAHLYPINMSLAGKLCLIVGGGKVAERKVASLLEYEPLLHLVSPQVEENIKHWASEGLLCWIPREFEIADLDQVFMVFIATSDTNVNRDIAALCRARGILVNAVDDPPNCDFFVPSVLRRDSLTVAISTEGKSPMYAARLRRELETIITEQHGQFVDMLGQIRQEVKKSYLDIEQRKQIMEKLVYSDILELIQAGLDEKIEERIKQCMSSLRD